LSKEEIESIIRHIKSNFLGMLREAEQFAEEDKVAKEKIDAKNSLESYIYSVKNQMEDEVSSHCH
jgi:molecular chaperone DnaK (HSP70)